MLAFFLLHGKINTLSSTPPISSSSRSEAIQKMFGLISGKYDFFNHFFSLGFDLWWRRCLISETLKYRPEYILDLATGSGDVALAFQSKGVKVMGADFCVPMLELARKKGVLELKKANALNLPFADHSFNAVTIAFGFRNFTDLPRALAEIYRVLKPEGYLHILEFSHPYWWLRPFYYIYLKYIMPLLTQFFTGQGDAYSYLNDSIRGFLQQEELCTMLEKSGFKNPYFKNINFGIVALHSARK